MGVLLVAVGQLLAVAVVCAWQGKLCTVLVVGVRQSVWTHTSIEFLVYTWYDCLGPAWPLRAYVGLARLLGVC